MDQAIRNKLRGVVTQCRRLLEDSVRQELQGKFGIYAAKKDDVQVDEENRLNLTAEERPARKDILDHFAHIKARGFKAKEALDQLVREIAFTHLNRLCAYKMMEARQVYVGDQKFREAVSRGVNSNGVKWYLAEHPDDERLFNTGRQYVAYTHFLDWLGGLLSEEIGVLFNPHDSANRLYPSEQVLGQVLDVINDESLGGTWAQDETIGWVYQYFTPKELRDAARDTKRGGSQAPRNSYELAFRNQFFTPRYVVEFLTDNTLGRTWYEMRRGNSKLKDQCRYLVRRPHEVFLGDPLTGRRDDDSAIKADDVPATVQAAFRGDFANAVGEKDGLRRYWIGRVVPLDQYEAATGHPFRENDDHPSVKEVWSAVHEHPEKIASLHPLKILVALSEFVRTASGGPYAARAADELWAALTKAVKAKAEQDDLSQDELLKQPVCIPFRAKKDPRELRILDPACGSGHFLLYCFDLLLTIYEEAYTDPDLGPKLKEEYPTLDALRRDIPRLILAHNLHGIDIDLRCTQIAALALWLRCQRAYREMGLKQDRPKITKSNIVCAEPMPGEQQLLQEFVGQLEPKLLGQLVNVVFDKMELAGEAGSLLKIEDDIRDAVKEAKQEWLAGPVSIQRSLFDEEVRPVARQQRFDFSGFTDDQFFDQAETKVVEALRNYAEQARNGKQLQRRLFAEDAVRGFAFLDICRQHFDVVLMNPPFGLAQKHLASLIKTCYPDTYVDLYASFVTRGLELAPQGMVGAITSRAFLMTKKLARWRTNELVNSMSLMLDLGSPVMDDAFVEACAFVASRASTLSSIVACDRRFSSDKHLPIALTSEGGARELCYCVTKESLRSLPQAKMLYSLPVAVHLLLKSKDVFEPDIGTAREGMRTFEDFRFLRLRWEVPPSAIGRKATWEPLSKGGEFAIYYSDIHLVVRWDRDGRELAEANRRVNGQTAQSRQASEFWRRAGATYSKRSVKGFSVNTLPADCIFGTKGPAVLSQSSVSPSCIIGWLNSRLMRFLVHVQANAFEFNTGIVKRLPWKNDQRLLDMEARTKETIERCREAAAQAEVNSCFVSPSVRDSLREIQLELDQTRESAERLRNETCACWDGVIDEVYGVDSSTLNLDDEDEAEEDNDDGEEDQSEEEQAPVGNDTHAIISYALGCVLGRWDVRFATGEKRKPKLPDPFEPLPVCAPGMLKGPDGLPCTMPPEDYPIRIVKEGYLVDDAEHPDDVVRRVRQILEVVWKNKADAIEKEACELLGVEELRDYLRKTGKGGFWDDHVSRYSKSRRKAPIYWLLQSSQKNYALWLYYHRLDKETLLKALLPKGPVQTKINLEQSRLDDLRKKRNNAEGDTKTAKKLDKEIDKQEDLLNEIKDFAEKLERAAKLEFGDRDKLNSKVQYAPDVNDGVVLNIAPLHELVPWKEAAGYWKELLEGEYEWSSISKLLREKGLVK